MLENSKYVEYIVYRRTTYMLKPYTRNRRIYDYLESSFVDNIVESNIIRRILKHSLWEVVLDKRDSPTVRYRDIPLAGKVRLVARVYPNESTRLEVFDAFGNGIGNYYSCLRDYHDCYSPIHKRLIIIDTNMSYVDVFGIINSLGYNHLLFCV